MPECVVDFVKPHLHLSITHVRHSQHRLICRIYFAYVYSPSGRVRKTYLTYIMCIKEMPSDDCGKSPLLAARFAIAAATATHNVEHINQPDIPVGVYTLHVNIFVYFSNETRAISSTPIHIWYVDANVGICLNVFGSCV